MAGNVATRRAGSANIIEAVNVDSAAFMRDLKEHLERLEVKSEKALVATGYAIQNVARGLCPVDTGRLRSSITSRPGRDGAGFYVEIGTNVSYAGFVEFGTYRRSAQPFLVPAIAQATGFMRAAVV